MGVKCIFSLSLSLLWLFCITYVNGEGIVFSVTRYGAIADGSTDNSKAFLGAWRDACGTHGGVILIPQGTFTVNGATFSGPCNGPTFFRNTGVIKASPGPHIMDYWILFNNINGLTVHGGGVFDGNGPSAWLYQKSRPTSIKICKCDNLSIHDVVSLNSKQFHFHVIVSANVAIRNVYIRAPARSPNTDGIHLGRCTNLSISDSRIATGDDCISLGDGSRNIDIESVVCGPGHGISIGSLGRYLNEEDVVGITVRNCTLIETTNGLRIKTWAPSTVSTTVSRVVFRDITIRNVRNPIIIDQYYCMRGSCSHARDSNIKINGIKYINVKGTSATPIAVNLQCSRSRPCRNLEFQGVRLTFGEGKSAAAICSSAQFPYMDSSDVPSKCVSPIGYKLGYGFRD